MRNKRVIREWIIKIVLHGVLLFGAYFLQAIVFPNLPIYGVNPVILPVVVTGVGMFEGHVRGGVFGLLAGMLCDISFNEPTIGFTLLLTAVGLIMGVLSNSILAKGFPSYVASSFVVLLASLIVQIFPVVTLKSVAGSEIVVTAIIQTLYSLVFTFPFFYAVRGLSRKTMKA